MSEQEEILSESGIISMQPAQSKSSEKRPKQLSADAFDLDGISLAEDHFAEFYDENGTSHSIKKFTWKNKNKIQVEIINYGARVISVKLPDRKGEIEDILLGFDDLAGYIFYDKFYFGSILGRTSNVVKNSRFSIADKTYSLSSNYGKHSIHGGQKGLDKIVFDTYITGKKVIMSHISPHLDQGYPGDLLIRISFELSAKNEFKVNINAQSTQPTCVDLSHLLYFNLAGHHAGPDEIYRHILTLNCNCYTPQTAENIPKGEILNVMHSIFDFQIPKLLGKVMGISPNDGFDQNLCVNRGMYQNECFVARMLHPPSGRMLEVYSNQPGVQLSTANDFGHGIILSMDEIVKRRSPPCPTPIETPRSDFMKIYEKIHDKAVEVLQTDENFSEIKDLIEKISSLKAQIQNGSVSQFFSDRLKLTSTQFEYLKKAKEIACENEETDDECLNLKDVLSGILKIVEVGPKFSGSVLKTDLAEVIEENLAPTAITSKFSEITHESLGENPVTNRSENQFEAKFVPSDINSIPAYYRNADQIRGKGRAVYKTHGGISLRTQNYPNAVNLKQFPNCVLNPGEIYQHDIVYRFWIRAGNPNKWIKRNLQEAKQRAKQK